MSSWGRRRVIEQSLKSQEERKSLETLAKVDCIFLVSPPKSRS